jgi:cell wall-associated NlpC family hydrolase
MRRLAALIACCLVVINLPLSAAAEDGIPVGSGAIVTAGQPLLVRVSPGWDAAAAYEIAIGSAVTVLGPEQWAPDGSAWYPVDGGFIPAYGVSTTAPQQGDLALYQEAAPQTTADPASQSAPVTPDAAAAPGQNGWVDPNTGQWVQADSTQQGWVDPATGQWVQAAPAQNGWVDPATGQWVSASQEAAPTGGTGVDPAAGTATNSDQNAAGSVAPSQEAAPEAAPVAAAPVDTAPTDVAPVDAAPTQPSTADQASAQNGWVDPATGQWVTAPADTAAPPQGADGSTAAAPAEPAKTGGVESWGEPIGTAYIAGSDGEGAICRSAPDQSSSKLAVFGEGEAVDVRGQAVGNWQPVDCAGVGGYVNTALISWNPPAAAPAPAPTDATDNSSGKRSRNATSAGTVGSSSGGGGSTSGGGKATATGQQIANYAMQYVGYPYSYAVAGPYSFDCSGFAEYVILNTTGIDITHDMFTQINMGQSVDRSQLQPGDLVFFANTFRPGLSHVGIYVGNGRFVHAENESTGVTVSDLNSDYYASRWAGATRIG